MLFSKVDFCEPRKTYHASTEKGTAISATAAPAIPTKNVAERADLIRLLSDEPLRSAPSFRGALWNPDQVPRLSEDGEFQIDTRHHQVGRFEFH